MMVSKVGLKKVFAGFVAALALYAPVPSAGEQSAKTTAAQATDAARPALDYEFFKARVQPIFLKTRSEDHVRCYACHQVPRHPAGLHLELLPPGQNTWTEEQSRRNFETVSKLAVPGAPLSSLFLLMPLVPEAGGMADTHQGGRQFASQNDADWKNMEAWVRGQKATGSSTP